MRHCAWLLILLWLVADPMAAIDLAASSLREARVL
jgi:hypothetical protein